MTVETTETKSGGHVLVKLISLIRSCNISNFNWIISNTYKIWSSRINASALMPAISSFGGSSANKTATSRMLCFNNAVFLFDATWIRLTAISLDN